MHLQQYGTFSKMREGTKENVLLLFLEKVIEGKLWSLEYKIQAFGHHSIFSSWLVCFYCTLSDEYCWHLSSRTLSICPDLGFQKWDLLLEDFMGLNVYVYMGNFSILCIYFISSVLFYWVRECWFLFHNCFSIKQN